MSLSPGQGAKRRHSRNSMQDDGKAADSASGATPATAGYPLSISATAPSTASYSGFSEPYATENPNYADRKIRATATGKSESNVRPGVREPLHARPFGVRAHARPA